MKLLLVASIAAGLTYFVLCTQHHKPMFKKKKKHYFYKTVKNSDTWVRADRYGRVANESAIRSIDTVEFRMNCDNLTLVYFKEAYTMKTTSKRLRVKLNFLRFTSPDCPVLYCDTIVVYYKYHRVQTVKIFNCRRTKMSVSTSTTTISPNSTNSTKKMNLRKMLKIYGPQLSMDDIFGLGISGRRTTISLHLLRNTTASAQSLNDTTVSPHSLRNTTASARSLDDTTVSPHSLRNTTASVRSLDNTTVSPHSLRNTTASARSLDDTTVSPHSLRNTTASARSLDDTTVSPHLLRKTTVTPQSLNNTTASPQSLNKTTATTQPPTSTTPLSRHTPSIVFTDLNNLKSVLNNIKF